MIVDLADQMSITSAVMFCDYDNMKRRVGVTSGCFDALHYYHLVYLMRCSAMCDMLAVGVDSDRKIRSEKSEDRPIVNERHRLIMVNALKYVDFTFIVDSLDSIKYMCNFLKPHLFFRNQEWIGREKEIVMGEADAQVVIIPDIEELTSTSQMVQKIEKQAKKRKDVR